MHDPRASLRQFTADNHQLQDKHQADVKRRRRETAGGTAGEIHPGSCQWSRRVVQWAGFESVLTRILCQGLAFQGLLTQLTGSEELPPTGRFPTHLVPLYRFSSPRRNTSGTQQDDSVNILPDATPEQSMIRKCGELSCMTVHWST